MAFITRNRPHFLLSTFDLVYNAAHCPNNFTPYIIIDRGQEQLYDPILDLYPDTRVIAVEHEEHGLNNCFRGTLAPFIESNSKYFITVCDDITHVIDHWDRRLIEIPDQFADGLWALYGQSGDVYRVPEVSAECYCVEPDDPILGRIEQITPHYPTLDRSNRTDLDFFVLYGFADPFPIITHTFARFVERVYQRVMQPVNSDMVMAGLLQQLRRITNEKRNVPGLPFHFRAANHGTTFGFMHGNPLDMELIKEVAGEMADYIASCADNRKSEAGS